MKIFMAIRSGIRLLRLVYRTVVYTYRYRLCWWRSVQVDTTSWISPRATLRGIRGALIVIGQFCEIHPYALIISLGGNIHIGNSCSVNPFTVIYGIGDVWIGSNVRIATSVSIVPSNHIQGTNEMPLSKSGITKIGIRIEDNVWIGAGARILDGVTIGRNAIIGAGAVVTRDVLPDAKVVGVPARPISKQ
jgi:acetyltransferase-like isoleucine patch superfamily enzyme